jgi:rhodanese-related sulfurtransferase
MKLYLLSIFLSLSFDSCTMKYQEIYPDELEEILSSSDNNDYVLLDVRTPQEYNQGHIPGAVLIDIYDPQFKQKVNELDKDKTLYVVCRSGNRSRQACEIMHDMGFRSLFNVEKGMLGWVGNIE